MRKTPLAVVAVATAALIVLVVLAYFVKVPSVITVAFTAMFGLLTVAYSQFLSVKTSAAHRLQDSQGIARALASEINTIANIFLSKGFSREFFNARAAKSVGVKPDVLLGLVSLVSQPVFEANVGRLALLGELEAFNNYEPGEQALVERVVGFYEGLMDLRFTVAKARLEGRDVSADELEQMEKYLASRAKTAFALSKRLTEFVDNSKSQSRST